MGRVKWVPGAWQGMSREGRGVLKCVWGLAVCWLDRRGSGGAHADLSDLGNSPGHLASFGLRSGEGPGAMLEAA